MTLNINAEPFMPSVEEDDEHILDESLDLFIQTFIQQNAWIFK